MYDTDNTILIEIQQCIIVKYNNNIIVITTIIIIQYNTALRSLQATWLYKFQVEGTVNLAVLRARVNFSFMYNKYTYIMIIRTIERATRITFFPLSYFRVVPKFGAVCEYPLKSHYCPPGCPPPENDRLKTLRSKVSPFYFYRILL